jgi:Carboxypeptidase regulatory-like domain
MKKAFPLAIVVMALALPASAWAQGATSNITGRATDTSGAALPGVTVSVTSANLIGGARTSVTDDEGVYRFTQLPGGAYTVKFELPGFTTLNIEGVNVLGGSTMTINGKMEVASLQETVTVTSQAPTIDLESSKVAVNWDQQKLDDLPYSRSLTSLISLVPGLYATSYDVGGSSFGTGSGPNARTFGRTGGNVVMYDGMVWDQTYGDYGSFEEAQITTASKGADAMNPGLSMNLVIKTGSNSYRGSGMYQYQNGDMQSTNVTDELLAKGYAPGTNKFTSLRDLYGEIGGPILKDRLWFYASYRDGRTGQFIPGFVQLSDRSQVEFFTKLENPTGKVTWQVSKSNKFEWMMQGGRKWQPYRSASRFVPLEASQNQDSYSMIGPSFKWLTVMGSRATLDASVQRGGYEWPDVPWSEDVRRMDITTTATRGQFLKQDRHPHRWQTGVNYTYFAEMFGKNHELKTGYMGWRATNETENIGYPNQQQYRYRSTTADTATGCNETVNWDGCFSRPDSVLLYDYPNVTNAGEWYHSGYINDKITLSRKMTLNVGLRYDRYSSFLPEQGNPGTGPWATENIYSYTDEFPVYSSFVPRVSAVYDVTGEGRIALRGSYGRYVGGNSGVLGNPGPAGSDVNPNSIITRTYSGWQGEIPFNPNSPNGARLTSTTGGGADRLIDPNIKGPFVDEYTAGLDIGLSRTTTIQFNYVRKYDGRGNKRLNFAQPYEAWTLTSTGPDPGRDNITGTADDRSLLVYSVPSAISGQTIERIVQLTDDESRNVYDAYGVTFNKQYSNNWSFLTSFDASRNEQRETDARNPNEDLYGPSTATNVAPGNGGYRHRLPEWNYAFRLSGTYQLPWGMLYASSFTAQSGDWFGREVRIRDANAANVDILVEAHVDRYDWVKLWDNRISKRFKTFGNQTIEGMLDIFNTANINTITSQTNRNGSAYLQPTDIIAARVMRVSVRYRF